MHHRTSTSHVTALGAGAIHGAVVRSDPTAQGPGRELGRRSVQKRKRNHYDLVSPRAAASGNGLLDGVGAVVVLVGAWPLPHYR